MIIVGSRLGTSGPLPQSRLQMLKLRTQNIVVWIPHRTTGLLGFLLLNTCSRIPALPICHHAQAMRPVCPACRWAPLPLWLAQPMLRSCFCSSHKANPSPGPPVSFADAAGGLSPARKHQTLTRTCAQAALLCLSCSWLLVAYKHGSYPAPLPDSLPPWCSVALAGFSGWSLQTASTALTEPTAVRYCPTDRCLLLQDVTTMPGFLFPQRSLPSSSYLLPIPSRWPPSFRLWLLSQSFTLPGWPP